MDSDHEKDKLAEPHQHFDIEESNDESSASEAYDDEFLQLKQEMRDLMKLNRNLNFALDESRRHNRSIVILTTLMVLCISSMYGYYTFAGAGANHSEQVSDVPHHEQYSLQKQVSNYFVRDKEYKAGDDRFYNTISMRLRMMPFNAMAIKSPLVLHDKLGMTGGIYTDIH